MRQAPMPRSAGRHGHWRLLSAIALAMALAASAGGALAGSGAVGAPGMGRAARGSGSLGEVAPGAGASPPAADRVAYAPWLGTIVTGSAAVDLGAGGAGFPYPSGITIQNAGGEVTRILAVFFRSSAAGECSACRAVAAACSDPLAPGSLWRAEAPGIADGEATSAALFSVSNAPAREGGEAWRAWLAGRG